LAVIIGRIAALVLGIATVITWVALDKLEQPTAWIDAHTPIIAGLFAAFVAATVVFNVLRVRNAGTGQETDAKRSYRAAGQGM
jgi:hypothetical protein